MRSATAGPSYEWNMPCVSFGGWLMSLSVMSPAGPSWHRVALPPSQDLLCEHRLVYPSTHHLQTLRLPGHLGCWASRWRACGAQGLFVMGLQVLWSISWRAPRVSSSTWGSVSAAEPAHLPLAHSHSTFPSHCLSPPYPKKESQFSWQFYTY